MGRRTSFVAWISVTRPETMKMAFTMFDDNANGRPMAPATNTGSSHTFDTSTCCNPSRAFFGVTFFSADEPASATLVSVFFLVAASPCVCVCVDGFSLAMVSLLDFHWVPKYNGDRLYGTRRVLPVLFLRKHYLDQVKGPGGRPSQPYSAPPVLRRAQS